MKIGVHQQQLSAKRIKKGFSQRKLAKQINRAVSYISQLESGKRNPSPESAKEICDVLETEFEELFYIQNVLKSERNMKFA
ncbi:helix-turn-helix domain-containing protein [Aneurinibacillus aneurinilyticus]|uniref:helix-turn-helix domain-containing protein n=1 Tax=Aneurinibacillus aneurinilyticus TaxID=1391 RepID=UPI0035256CF7